ncbi:MAG: matrixin family metalloprotease [bacterium]|nr:matrixin family metalloprotease [bacterium]
MKKYLILGLIFGLLVSVGVALAAKPNFIEKDVIPSGGHATVSIPEGAAEVAPGVFYLGISVDNGRLVEGYAFVDYKKGFAKPPWAGGGKNGGTDTSSCYGFLAKGAKWKVIEDWVVNPANTEGLTNSFILSNLSGDIGKWEAAAGADILGGGSVTSATLVADTNSPDKQNEVYFADIDSPGAIGVTIVWGIFGGPPFARELVEWDQVYDDVDFNWSSVGEAGKMDFENIATHELGHSVGMGDLYESTCSEQTMYGYASYGETKKQTLEAGDIAGIQKLY